MTSTERMIKNLNTNLFGAINLARAILPTFRKKNAGIIVWSGSCGGWQGEIGAGPYCATKFAMEGRQSSRRPTAAILIVGPVRSGRVSSEGDGILRCTEHSL